MNADLPDGLIARVALGSVTENIDLSMPMGRVFFGLLAVYAKEYSDNLSWHTKKGKQERKRQGQYNVLLPFGLRKADSGLPVPDPKTYSGLLLAYETAAAGKSDREVAVALNTARYRTRGNRGDNPWAKDGVRGLL